MGRAMIPVVDNPIYSEILARMGTLEIHANKFVHHFVVGDGVKYEQGPKGEIIAKRAKPHKKQQVLARQMKLLANEGWLKTRTEKGGKKLPKNMTLYRLNFDKVVVSYLDRLLSEIKTLIEKGRVEDADLVKECKAKIKSADFRKRCKQNKIVREIFESVFEDLRRSLSIDHRYVTLNEVFELLSRVMFVFDEDVVRNQWKWFAENNGPSSCQDITQHYRKGLTDDWEWFVHDFLFVHNFRDTDGLAHFLRKVLPHCIGLDLLEGWDDKTRKYLSQRASLKRS